MQRAIYIILSVLLVALPASAKKTQAVKPAALSVEQQQQFTYYWYAARQAITEERYADAYALLQFCNAIHPHDGQTLTFIGMMYEAMGDTQRALGTYREAFEADPKGQWYRYMSALLDTHTEEGAKTALAALEKAYQGQKADAKSKKTNVDENLLEQLKRLYIGNRQWKKALKIQNELDEVKGYDAYSAMTQYRIYAMWDKPKKAIAAIDRYLELDPSELQFLYFRLELLERTGAKQKDLYAMYDRILEFDPYNRMVLNNYAYHLATHGGDMAKAERMSQVTIRQEPNNPTYLDTYGWIMHLQGQDELALFYLQKALWNATDQTKEEVEYHIKEIKGEK